MCILHLYVCPVLQSVLPFFVATKMSKIRRSSLLVPDPNGYARSALATVGIQGRTFGCISHAIQVRWPHRGSLMLHVLHIFHVHIIMYVYLALSCTIYVFYHVVSGMSFLFQAWVTERIPLSLYYFASNSVMKSARARGLKKTQKKQ